MGAIRIDQRYADATKTTPGPNHMNVYDGDRYVGSMTQWANGQWCYGSREQVSWDPQQAARFLVKYMHELYTRPDVGLWVRVTCPGVDDHIGAVEAWKQTVFTGKTNMYAKVSGDPYWHALDQLQTV